MQNPQVLPAPQSDIEQGKKEIYEVGNTVALPLASSPDTNNTSRTIRQTFCCSNSARTGSIYWFIISLIFELAVLISSCLQDEDVLVVGIIASALFLILTIQGLVACYLFKSTQIMVALVGVMIKTLLNLIGFIALLAITAESVKIE
ncbi:predicted protein [Chaetoceros tenuissimus]|uniref:Uncharacterized protein n=1 Tax=Chaetoceros tenuissimus TaxID=426638 RepID=A0AAD3H126_9STRA|nr:predicted protein [Chaetoceros tenuissimus]